LIAPNRFSSFVEGTSHLSDNEILSYESDVSDDGDHYIRRSIHQPLVPVQQYHPLSPMPQDLITDDEDSLNNTLETDDDEP